MPVPLIVNPVAGHGAGRALAEHLIAHLRDLGVSAKLEFTDHPGHAETLIRAAAEAHALVLVAGGDGTLNEAVNGAMCAARTPSLGLIPIGTGNDFAKMLDLDHDWRHAEERIASGLRRQVDVGRCNERYFANGIGIGFDAQVAMEANRVRYLRGNGVYVLALLRTLALRYATPHVTVTYEGGRLRQTITLIAAANGCCYGGVFRIAPQADISDGYLELVVARGLTRGGILRLIPKVLRGSHVHDPAVRVLRTRWLTVDSEVPLPVHADGEILSTGMRKFEIELLPKALTILG